MEHQLRVSLDHLLEGVQVVDREWRYVYLNATAAAHGQRPVEELLGRTMMECYPGIEHTELFVHLRRVMELRKPERLRNEFTYPNGEKRWFDLVIDPVPDGVCILSLDVTDRHAAEIELQQAQRMEAIGKLAGGVAHDFNNQLTAIRGFAELLLETVKDEIARRDVHAILDAANRSAALTRQLLAFGRRQSFSIEPVDLNAVVQNVHQLLNRLIGADVQCELRLHSSPPRTLADAPQLENILTNLVLNARDAMPDGGRLTIATDVVELTDEDARQHPTMRAGRYAVLSVTDTGHGMDEETKARIFEPFFTTKTLGRGTGLGLSTVYGTVKQLGGFIWVYSEPKHGTTFRLYFPTTTELPRPKAPAPRRKTSASRATILVIEDDASVRDLIARALSDAGHVVITAASGAEASSQLAHRPGTPDLLITDIVLPGESGPQIVRRLGVPENRVLYMSGYIDRPVEGAIAAVLEKPFTLRALLDAVDDVLSGRQPEQGESGADVEA
ncbi:MAG TPA: ATP-binding protein [Vicinamibacterales bacterium]|nr:ATP-binding protein [Vicinamibacterales bacterium]